MHDGIIKSGPGPEGSSAAAKAAKGGRQAVTAARSPEGAAITLHGPPGLAEFYRATWHFIRREDFHVVVDAVTVRESVVPRWFVLCACAGRCIHRRRRRKSRKMLLGTFRQARKLVGRLGDPLRGDVRVWTVLEVYFGRGTMRRFKF